jgi:23S rRNA pseudouridine1911/1915/1917 synthase
MTEPTPPPRRWTEHTVAEDEAGRTVQEILTGPMRISGRMIQRLTRARGILLNRRPGFLARKVRAGDVVAARIALDEEPGLPPVEMPLRIVHEDRELLLLDKPPHLLVHPTAPTHTATLAHGVAHHFARQGLQARVRPVHRIDRDVSGLVLFAKSGFAHADLDRQLREHSLRREYCAWVAGRIADETGHIEAPIGKHKQNPSLRAVRPQAGDPATTRFQVLERFAGATRVLLELEAGRTHQIRVHLAHIGHPLLGDRAYGGPEVRGLRRPALHAWRLAFTHPADTERRLAFEAPTPPDLLALEDGLRAAADG